jgi:hypothetical protein
MPTFIKAGFWEQTCNPCNGYKGWLNLDKFVQNNSGSSGSGSSGTSGISGSNGITGTSGSAGTSGASGTAGSAGTSGLTGTSGSSGLTGTSGLSGDRYQTTTTNTLTLQTGVILTFTVETGLAYTPAQDVIVSYNASNHMHGILVSYNSGTGLMQVDMITQTGSGTYSSWTVNLNGAAGGDGSSGTSGSAGTSGAGTSGTSGVAGTSGSAGTSGASGTNGSSGTAGITGTAGTSGVSGVAGLSYGSFYDTATQTINTVSTGQPVLVRQTDATCTNGFSVVNNSRITALNAGKYNFQFSFELHNEGGGGNGTTVEIWLVKNGNPVPDTNTRIAVNTNSPYVVAAWNFLVAMSANDYMEIYWATDNQHIVLRYNTGTMGGPTIPSTIITVSQIG